MYGSQINNPVIFQSVVNFATNSLKDIVFDTLVFRGFSGALVGPTVALQLNKAWALVRKPGDTAHSNRRVEGFAQGKYVIIDDFIDTGETIRSILEAVAESYTTPDIFNGMSPEALEQPKPECVGVVLYEEHWVDKTFDDQRWFEGKIRGLKVLNWKNREPQSNFERQTSCVGRMTFMKPFFMDFETSFHNPWSDMIKSAAELDHIPVGKEIAF